MKVLILIADSNGGYPVPSVKGGSVSTLVEHLVAGNNMKQLCDMEILSFYNPDAKKKAEEEYPNVKFSWVKVPGILKLLDKCVFNFIRVVKKNEKAISFRSPFSLIYYIWKAKKVTNQTDVDKIVIENNIPLARVMKDSKFKGQWYYHFHNVPRIDAGCREEFQNVTKFICVSQFVADQLIGKNSAIGQIPPEKIMVLYNCVDTDLFRTINKNDLKIVRLKKKYGFTDDDYICIFVGRLSEEKGADKLLEALYNIKDNVKCIIAGSLLPEFDSMTDYEKKLYRIAKKISKRVTFTGYINQKDLPYYYNIANIAVLPSMWDEPAGLTNLEAMACGLPVITTDAGGIPEYSMRAEIVHRSDNVVREIVRIINSNLESNVRMNISISNNSEYIETNYSSKTYISKFISILN